MKTTYLVHELNKWLALQEQDFEAFLQSFTADKHKQIYIREKVLPVIERDSEQLRKVIVREAERLLKDKDEKWIRQTTQA